MSAVRRRKRSLSAVVATLVLAVTAIAASAALASSSESSGTQQGKITLAMVTHGDGGTFWSVAKKGALQAAKDLGITVRYSESNNDPKRQSQLIETAVAQKVQGLAVSAPNPPALKNSLNRAKRAGIPIVTLNSGSDVFKSLGAFTHVGQTETVAGRGAGEQFNAAKAKHLLCVIHEQANIGLTQRCNGAKGTFKGKFQTLQVAGTGDIQTSKNQVQAKLQADKSIDAVLSLNTDITDAIVDAIAGARSQAKLATFDLSAPVLADIKRGNILFAIDQQQYTQGYLSVVFLYLNVTNLNTVGGGLPVLTGPGFVTKSNAARVEALAKKGTR
jgi:simple sugar transport system substrate-binding protein